MDGDAGEDVSRELRQVPRLPVQRIRFGSGINAGPARNTGNLSLTNVRLPPKKTHPPIRHYMNVQETESRYSYFHLMIEANFPETETMNFM